MKIFRRVWATISRMGSNTRPFDEAFFRYQFRPDLFCSSTREIILSLGSVSSDERARFVLTLGQLTNCLLTDLRQRGLLPTEHVSVLELTKLLTPLEYDGTLLNLADKMEEGAKLKDQSLEWAAGVLSKALLGIHPCNQDPMSYAIAKAAGELCDQQVRILLERR